MPYYYSVDKTPGTPGTMYTANGTPNTKSTHARLLTVANQQIARVISLLVNARFNTAGGAMLALIRGGAAGTGGTANTPSKKNPLSRAADTTAFDDAAAITAGTTPIQQLTVGFAQTGGQGGWVALEIDDAFAMQPNGGANGNLEVASFASTASVTFDATVNLQEN